ncbi:hypothetical protein [uncultured Helicobacter sp.]|uniref:hypothetical protein n=1 Tax=uncultured Helicobacter sp. TaxID=175537 RepID=UPI0025F05EB0|nr:hypothetical protein [uncultured Helicobacter sp.]
MLDRQLENLGDYTTPRGFLCMSLLKALESSLDAFKPEKIITYHHRFLKHKAPVKSYSLHKSIYETSTQALKM